MNQSNLPISINPNILKGTPVFLGSRVPVKTLFEYLENNYSLDEFLDCFPTVSRQNAIAVLENAWQLEYNEAVQCAS
ncbi:MAG: DUF433 domain-containing protein [Ignavibacteriales bacterium]|nr:DUF433 domain-containing protein [Ignavibacteriales bacterium]